MRNFGESIASSGGEELSKIEQGRTFWDSCNYR